MERAGAGGDAGGGARHAANRPPWQGPSSRPAPSRHGQLSSPRRRAESRAGIELRGRRRANADLVVLPSDESELDDFRSDLDAESELDSLPDTPPGGLVDDQDDIQHELIVDNDDSSSVLADGQHATMATGSRPPSPPIEDPLRHTTSWPSSSSGLRSMATAPEYPLSSAHDHQGTPSSELDRFQTDDPDVVLELSPSPEREPSPDIPAFCGPGEAQAPGLMPESSLENFFTCSSHAKSASVSDVSRFTSSTEKDDAYAAVLEANADVLDLAQDHANDATSADGVHTSPVIEAGVASSHQISLPNRGSPAAFATDAQRSSTKTTGKRPASPESPVTSSKRLRLSARDAVARTWNGRGNSLRSFWSTFRFERDETSPQTRREDAQSVSRIRIALDVLTENCHERENDYNVDHLRRGANLTWLRSGKDQQQRLVEAVATHSAHFRHLTDAKASVTRSIVRMIRQYWSRRERQREKERRADDRARFKLAKWTGREVMKQWQLAIDLVHHRLKEEQRKDDERAARKHLDAILEQSAQVLGMRRAQLYSASATSTEASHGGERRTLPQPSVTRAPAARFTRAHAAASDTTTATQSAFKAAEALRLDDHAQSEDENDGLDESLLDDSGASLTSYSSDEGSYSSQPSDTASVLSSPILTNGDLSTTQLEADDKRWAKFLVIDDISVQPSSQPSIMASAAAHGSGRGDDDDDDSFADDSDTSGRDPRLDGQLNIERVQTGGHISVRGVTPTSIISSDNIAPGQHNLPTPFLFRGILRPYQHAGLDWLASLNASGANGILADEMGLGKTIQTIALLAHLACHHGNWGPHLVIVPTSVILNWEVEFKKFFPGFKILSYFGTKEEREAKRKGWLLPNAFNVCITSYHIAVADARILKCRSWHYLILDEAHHIKNCRSERWRTLLGLNSQRRLLLTGTPLQHSLLDLWSLMFFLMPNEDEQALKGYGAFASLYDFQEWFSKPLDSAINAGGPMDEGARAMVSKLHTVLRPFVLRRLKKDVEKELPKKHEHVVLCRLSKRQRYLYNDFMARAKTRESLASGTYFSIINCLMQLRKVCNHPDLFEERPIITSFAAGRAVAAQFEIKELLIRRRMLESDSTDKINFGALNADVTAREHLTPIVTRSIERLDATAQMPYFGRKFPVPLAQDTWSIEVFPAHRERLELIRGAQQLQGFTATNERRCKRHPIYGEALIRRIRQASRPLLAQDAVGNTQRGSFMSCDDVRAMVLSYKARAATFESTIERFAVITSAATTCDIAQWALPGSSTWNQPELQQPEFDALHTAATRLHIAFPERSLLQYDCGKLQQLDKLMRRLKSGGHRFLIFTQMTKMLNILESFLNHQGYRYLRLDGSTKVEQRQLLTERFNRDVKIDAFILSTRSGGLGINLVGADTVIFYDLDWNPAIEAQCMDRAHRIGQTRDVHIYRFVSEHTIEENMLRKADQKRQLNSVVIQEGNFNTDTLIRHNWRDMLDEGGVTIAGVPVGRTANTIGADADGQLKLAEDEDDAQAARAVEAEGFVENADHALGRVGEGEEGRRRTPSISVHENIAAVEDDEGPLDKYMIKFVHDDWSHFSMLSRK